MENYYKLAKEIKRKLDQNKDGEFEPLKVIEGAISDYFHSSKCQMQTLVRQLPSDEEIGEIVQEIAYKQHHEEQADDFLEKIYILREWLLRQSA